MTNKKHRSRWKKKRWWLWHIRGEEKRIERRDSSDSKGADLFLGLMWQTYPSRVNLTNINSNLLISKKNP